MRLAVSVGLATLTPTLAIAQIPAEKWTGLVKESVSVVFECYKRQTIHALQSDVEPAAFRYFIVNFCKDERATLVDAWIGALKTQGRSDNDIKDTIADFIGDMDANTVSAYAKLRRDRKK